MGSKSHFPAASVLLAWNGIGALVVLCSLNLPPQVGAFQPLSITLQPNDGNSSFWPPGIFTNKKNAPLCTAERCGVSEGERWRGRKPYTTPSNSINIRVFRHFRGDLQCERWKRGVDLVGSPVSPIRCAPSKLHRSGHSRLQHGYVANFCLRIFLVPLYLFFPSCLLKIIAKSINFV